MREKSLQVVITFHTTSAAMAMERLCRARPPGRLAPAPRDVTSDCGIAWCAPASGPARFGIRPGSPGVCRGVRTFAVRVRLCRH